VTYPDIFSTPERPDHADLLADPWLATSALQKSIRRGLQLPALLATSFLLDRQPDRFWRRIVVIALEDVGIGDLQLVHEVLAISGRKQWRAERGGDWSFAANLVVRMCEAPKSRDACDALVNADLHPELREQRSAFLDLGTDTLSDIVAAEGRPLGERTLAAWLVAGTKRFPALNLPTRIGSFGDLLDIYEAMGVRPDVLSTAQMGSTRTIEGHPLSLPLIWLLAASSGEIDVRKQNLPDAPMIGGWPAFALDMHTMLGKRAIRRFQRECREIDQLALRWLPRDQHELFVGTLLFRFEGENVDQRLVYPGSQALLRTAEVAHLTHQGLPRTLVSDALSILKEHLDLLHQCRVAVAGRNAR